ncbi:MAG: hypothetical protein NC331_07585 [Lachnospiraceae bacterium]|nr:hypothetical protein [Lachnospiraceae bacterium]MCM1239234.1 hypothetical protein [Lachnospiraceae bacterium]
MLKSGHFSNGQSGWRICAAAGGMGVRMKGFLGWWKQDKRYLTMAKAVLMALLPVACCLVHCAMQGKSIGDVYLPCSEWNDELFYYKQVEGIVSFGYPQGYFGFNESHALRLSFAAWSPVLVLPWILWGVLFGWNMMSPVICNILLMTLACFLFVWLVRPDWKQVGVTSLLFCLYTPFVRYMLSVMPEVICFSLLIIFESLAVNYLNRERGYKLVLLFALSGILTLMRPYMLLFMLLPAYFWIRKGRWKGFVGSTAVFAAVLAVYAAVKHYLGAEYFAPLFFTDWVDAFFEQGLMGGIRYTLVKLYYMASSFKGHTIQGFRTGLASGAFFAGYLVVLAVLSGQSVKDWSALRRVKRQTDREEDAEKTRAMERKAAESTAGERGERLKRQLIIEVHFVFSLVAMLFALLLMYKLTEGSKHLLTFMAAGVFLIGMMETRFFKKAVAVGAAFAYFYSYMALDPYDYQVPFAEEQRAAQVEEWRNVMGDVLVLDEEGVPGYRNSVIWVFNDRKGEATENMKWQLLYAIPEGFGISCCENGYVLEHFEELQSRYIATLAGGEVDARCREAGYAELNRDGDVALYQVY